MTGARLLIETDILLAAINPHDPARAYAVNVLDNHDLRLSPYSLVEINLLARARKLKIENFDDFADDLTTFFQMRNINILQDKPQYHANARKLESGFELTFFDSLHAAVAKVEREVIVSFDKVYDRLSDEGVKRLDPKKL